MVERRRAGEERSEARSPNVAAGWLVVEKQAYLEDERFLRDLAIGVPDKAFDLPFVRKKPRRRR